MRVYTGTRTHTHSPEHLTTTPSDHTAQAFPRLSQSSKVLSQEGGVSVPFFQKPPILPVRVRLGAGFTEEGRRAGLGDSAELPR